MGDGPRGATAEDGWAERLARKVVELYTERAGLIGIERELSRIGGLSDSHELLSPRLLSSCPTGGGVSVLLCGNPLGRAHVLQTYADTGTGAELLPQAGAYSPGKIAFFRAGTRRKSFRGARVLREFPQFATLRKIAGVSVALRGEIVPARVSNFHVTTFVDFSGLEQLEGASFSYDAVRAFLMLAHEVDSVLFFERSVDSALSGSHPGHAISPLDSALAELRRSSLNCNVFRVPQNSDPSRRIQARIDGMLGRAVAGVDTDARLLLKKIGRIELLQTELKTEDSARKARSVMWAVLGILIFPMLIAFVASRHTLLLQGEGGPLWRIGPVLRRIGATNAKRVAALGLTALCVISLVLAKTSWRPTPVLSRKRLAALHRYKESLNTILAAQKELARAFPPP